MNSVWLGDLRYPCGSYSKDRLLADHVPGGIAQKTGTDLCVFFLVLFEEPLVLTELALKSLPLR